MRGKDKYTLDKMRPGQEDRDAPKVCVVILNWNGLQDTVNCLESLEKTAYSNYEVIVVDNGSEGNDATVLKDRFGHYVHLVENEENLGYAEGSNVGIRHAIHTFNPDYIAVLDNDTKVDSRWLAELVHPLSADDAGTLGATCSLIRDLSCPDRIRYGGSGKMNIFGQTWASSKIEQETLVRTFAGPSCLIRKSALDQLETPFCSEFFIYYNDIDLSWRLDTLGYELRYVPTSVVFHKESASARSEGIRERNAILKARNKYLIFYRNLSFGKFMLILPLLFIYDIAITTATTVYRRNPRFLVTRAKGILGFFRAVRKVKHVGGGRLSYLDRRLYLDQLG